MICTERKDEKMEVLIVEPMKRPRVETIDSDLKKMQEIVGGYIEVIYPFQDDVAFVCNEEGKFKGLPLNRALTDGNEKVYDIIAGTFFICRAPEGSDSFESLTPTQIEMYEERFKSPEKFLRIGGEIMVFHLHEVKEREAGGMER